jgi:hypothetical protein
MMIIFLDIDGVVATRKSYSSYRMDRKWGVSDVPFDTVSVANLNKITDATGAKIVISSSWRAMHKLDELKQIFLNEGITGEIIGITPDSKYSVSRGKEIHTWLNDKWSSVESFVILDDEVFDIKQLFENNMVQTSMVLGLTEDFANKAIEILQKTND